MQVKKSDQKKWQIQEISDSDENDEQEKISDEKIIISKSSVFLIQWSLSAAISSSHWKKRSRLDDKKIESMIQTNNAFADYFEWNSDSDKWLEIVKNKLIEILNFLKSQFHQNVIQFNNNLNSQKQVYWDIEFFKISAFSKWNYTI